MPSDIESLGILPEILYCVPSSTAHTCEKVAASLTSVSVPHEYEHRSDAKQGSV